MYFRLSLERGLDQLIVTLYKLSIYPSVHNKLIRIILEARPKPEDIIIGVHVHGLKTYIKV